MLYYYLRLWKGELRIESDVNPPDVSMPGFIRLAPEIAQDTSNVTPKYILSLMDECKDWSLSAEDEAKVRAGAKAWISKFDRPLKRFPIQDSVFGLAHFLDKSGVAVVAINLDSRETDVPFIKVSCNGFDFYAYVNDVDIDVHCTTRHQDADDDYRPNVIARVRHTDFRSYEQVTDAIKNYKVG